jgi:hypothetical protein
MQRACAVPNCHLWPVRFYHIFTHYLIHGTIFGGGRGEGALLNIKCMFAFTLHLSQGDQKVSVHVMITIQITLIFENFSFKGEVSEMSEVNIGLHVKYPLFLSDFNKS